MFSNLYYLSQLIGESLAISEVEKIEILNYAKKHPNKILKFISIFKDEQKGIQYIKKEYKKGLEKITNNVLKNIEQKDINKKNRKKNLIKERLKKIKLEEEKEKANIKINL